METALATDLVVAITSWLDFQILCARTDILSEHSVKHPVGEFLLARQRRPISAEYDHPTFVSEARGRNRQVDFVLLDGEALDCAIELKWCGKSKLSADQIIGDILRLEVLHTSVPGRASWFLVAGFEDARASFEVTTTRNQGDHKIFQGLIPLKQTDGPSTIDVENLDTKWRNPFIQFRSDYKVELPKSFEIACVAEAITRNSWCRVWDINQANPRTTFTGWPDAGQ